MLEVGKEGKLVVREMLYCGASSKVERQEDRVHRCHQEVFQ